MAFNASDLSSVAHLNKGRSSWIYITPDSLSTVLGAGYFNSVDESFTGGDAIAIYARDGYTPARVVAVVGGDVSLVGLGQSGGGGVVAVTDSEYAADPTGVADSTDAFNKALVASACVYIPPGTYKVAGTILMPSRTTLYGAGEGATILQATTNAPVIASRNWVADLGIAPAGRAVIRDLAIVGTANSAHTSQVGILLREYYSDIFNITFQNLAGSNIKLTHFNSAGALGALPTDDNLVENRIQRIRCRDALGTYALELGASNNSKLTDGILRDVIIDLAGTTGTQTGILIGSAAGWMIDNVHSYGVPCDYLINAPFSFRTFISNIYCEAYLNRVVHTTASGEVFISNVVARGNDAAHNSWVVNCDIVAAATATYHVNGVQVAKSAGGNFTRCITVNSGATVYVTAPPIRTGSQVATITPYFLGATGILHAPRENVIADAGNADDVTFGGQTTDQYGTVIFNTPITADRACGLPSAGLYAGQRRKVIRTAAATGAFNVNIGTGPIKALGTAGTFAHLLYTGSAWICEATGNI